jgi:hypothetical protein
MLRITSALKGREQFSGSLVSQFSGTNFLRSHEHRITAFRQSNVTRIGRIPLDFDATDGRF